MPKTSWDALQFHIVDFNRRDEAAAFVAALSRVLSSPRGDSYAASRVEVWADVASTDRIRLFLSDGAFAIADSAFSPVPVTGTATGDPGAHGHRLIIKGGETPAWGLAEANLRLSDDANTSSIS
jgi:hypothetical protein